MVILNIDNFIEKLYNINGGLKMVFTITEDEDGSDIIHVKYEFDVYDWAGLRDAMEMLDEYFGD